ncbi:MAG TPA: HD domain-containing phosphohydrolase [Nocardioidaceae bacterium]|nr:HD domain-containing phosphohydrolase [Nocardioidaceae bacterium]
MSSQADAGSGAGVRRAEVLAALSISIDLGLGLPMEHVLRSSLIAAMLAEELGLDDEQRAGVFYTNLILWIGCHADSHEYSRWFGDDIAIRRASYELDWAGLPYLRFLLRSVGTGQAAAQRTRTTLAMLMTPRTRLGALIHSHCLSAGSMAEHIGLDRQVSESLVCAFERFDGSGLPAGLRGGTIPLATRVVQLADTVEVHLRSHGIERALGMARDRSGTQFDPMVVDALFRCRSALASLPDEDVWTRALELAPDHDLVLHGEQLDALLRAIGDFADLKCPFTVGHSRAVADLAASAAAQLGLPELEVRRVRRAGYLHDLGKMGVPNSIWERAAPLSEADRERIRLYPYLTGRILSRVRGLEVEASIAQRHRERQDGSGYPLGLRGASLAMAQRLLAAADSYRGSLEQRPHRPALGADAATRRLQREAATGRLDASAVNAVLAVAGRGSRHRARGPAGLTAREVEVLGLVAHGCTNVTIARQLSISHKTVRNHLEHIYLKAGVSNRAGAALFAVEHGLAGRVGYEAAAP